MSFQSDIQELDPVQREMRVTVDAEETSREVQRVTRQLVRHARLPGFRPGKAPAALVKTRYRDTLQQEVVEALVHRTLPEAFRQADLRPVHVGGVREVDLPEDGPLTYTATFEVAPEIELGDYRDLEVRSPSARVEDEEVEEQLEKLREAHAVLEPVDREEVEEGDYVLCDFIQLPLAEGEQPRVEEDVFLVAGAEDHLDELNEALSGAEVGETVSVEVEHDASHPDRALAGRTVSYKVRVKGIKRKTLPELDDELVREETDAASVEDLRSRIRESMGSAKAAWARNVVREQLVDALLERHPFPAPPSLVRRRADRMLRDEVREIASRGMDPRTLAVDWEEQYARMLDRAERNVRARFLLDKIAEAEDVSVSEQEIDAEIQRIAESEEVAPESVRAKLEADESLDAFRNSILQRKILDFLVDGATIVAEDEEE